MQSLEDIPTWLSTTWGIDLTSAQIIISVAVIMALVIPILVIAKDSKASGPLAVLFSWIGMALCVGLGWLPLWIMIVSILVTGIGGALLFGGIFGGD